MKNNKRAAMFTVFLAVMIDLIGFGIVLPLLPFFATEFKANPVEVGLLYSIFSFAQFICAPIWGSCSDRIGRRPVMLLSTFGASLAYLLFAFAGNLWVLFFSRLVAGIMGGNISTAQAYVADITEDDERTKGMGFIGAAFGIGFLLGPALATLLIQDPLIEWLHLNNHFKFMLPGLFASLLSFLSFLLVFTKLPETITNKKPLDFKIFQESILARINLTTSWRKPAKEKNNEVLLLLLWSIFILTFSQSSLYSSFPLFCKKELGLTASNVGMLFAFMGLIAVLIQGGMIRYLVRKFHEINLFLAGSIIITIGLTLIPFSSNYTWLFLFISLMSVGASLMIPVLQSLISKQTSSNDVGALMGTAQSLASLGRVLGPTWGGLLFAIYHPLPFLITGAVLSITIVTGFLIKTKLNRETATTGMSS